MTYLICIKVGTACTLNAQLRVPKEIVLECFNVSVEYEETIPKYTTKYQSVLQIITIIKKKLNENSFFFRGKKFVSGMPHVLQNWDTLSRVRVLNSKIRIPYS